MSASPIQSRIPAPDYFSIDALSISMLKELRRSPLHFRHSLTNPKESKPMALGTAAHCATLEPERFGSDYAIWSFRTESGRMSPRTGKKWEEFCAAQAGKIILTEDDCSDALTMAKAVRSDPIAMKYLEAGEPEVTMQWQREDGRLCKGRVDWLTHIDGEPCVVGLKTARDCRPYIFGSAAAKLGYALQWFWYMDGYRRLTGATPRMIEIVVESAAPHAVVTYVIPDDVLEYGRDQVEELLTILDRCEAEGVWPGPAETELVLTLPSWCYQGEDSLDDLGLVA
jgi:hypothetical protein